MIHVVLARFLRRIAAIAGTSIAALMVAACLPAGAADLPTAELTIHAADRSHRFSVELALTPADQARGLMYRQSLPGDAGMLFDYGLPPQPVSMWMKNTYIPLDMIFIDAEGRIARIAERTVPHSLATIESGGPVRAVLEVNGGTAARLGLRPGDRVQLPGIHGSRGTKR
jgi:uncharacterized membrane protein (UPF0127 family)